MNIKLNRQGSGDYQHFTLGDLRKLLKEFEQVDDCVELRIEVVEPDNDSVTFLEGAAPTAIRAELTEELWLTIEGE